MHKKIQRNRTLMGKPAVAPKVQCMAETLATLRDQVWSRLMDWIAVDHFRPAMKRCRRASSMAKSLPKTLVKSSRRLAAGYSAKAGRLAVLARSSKYFLGIVSI